VSSSKRLAYLGPAGTHTEQACISYESTSMRVPFASNSAVATAVVSGLADEGVVPIENSQEGSVNETLDLLIREVELCIRYELVLPIKNYLVSKKGASLEDVKVVYSHPQALAQCRSFLTKRFPDAELMASMSTAAAVEEMLTQGNGSAAIATRRAAELYGAQVLAENIEENPNNMTRFVVLALEDHTPTGEDKTSICFSFDSDGPGKLQSVLEEFAVRRINLAKIESRPTKEHLGRYIFLVDLDGHREDSKVKEALRDVEDQVSIFKIFGSYPRHRAAG